jgi:hypothetical protein
MDYLLHLMSAPIFLPDGSVPAIPPKMKAAANVRLGSKADIGEVIRSL